MVVISDWLPTSVKIRNTLLIPGGNWVTLEGWFYVIWVSLRAEVGIESGETWSVACCRWMQRETFRWAQCTVVDRGKRNGAGRPDHTVKWATLQGTSGARASRVHWGVDKVCILFLSTGTKGIQCTLWPVRIWGIGLPLSLIAIPAINNRTCYQYRAVTNVTLTKNDPDLMFIMSDYTTQARVGYYTIQKWMEINGCLVY